MTGGIAVMLCANERGAAMMAALAILLMIGMIGAAVVQTSSTDMTIAENY